MKHVDESISFLVEFRDEMNDAGDKASPDERVTVERIMRQLRAAEDLERVLKTYRWFLSDSLTIDVRNAIYRSLDDLTNA